jgi:hypothetical protein
VHALALAPSPQLLLSHFPDEATAAALLQRLAVAGGPHSRRLQYTFLAAAVAAKTALARVRAGAAAALGRVRATGSAGRFA